MAPYNLKLTVGYDGTGFAGWQVQPGQRTVQGVLEAALGELAGSVTGRPIDRVAVTGAGRTDAGVHAVGQVASVPIDFELAPDRVAAALNARLPNDVFVKDASEVPDSFHARFSAVRRTYAYLMSREESPLWRNRRWFVRHPLDEGAMRRAAEALEGEHDYSSFCVSEERWPRICSVCSVALLGVDWAPLSGEMLMLRVEADRFLRGMVRSIVGTLVDVGRGRTSPEDLAAILEARDRGLAGATAPAHGLYLVRVSYGK